MAFEKKILLIHGIIQSVSLIHGVRKMVSLIHGARKFVSLITVILSELKMLRLKHDG